MSQTEISLLLQSRVYVWSSLLAGFVGITGLLFGHTPIALTALAFALLLGLSSTRHRLAEPHEHGPLAHLIVIFLCAATLISMIGLNPLVEAWSFVVPLLLFLFYPLPRAIRLAALYSLAFVVLGWLFFDALERMQVIINFVLCGALTGVFVYLREAREQALKPLTRTDDLTLALTPEHLYADLEKEIQRSEREGTGLAVLALGIDNENPADQVLRDQRLNLLGQCLNQQLRAFDSYYRLKTDEFLLLMPNTGAKQGLKAAEKLRVNLRKQLSTNEHKVSVSIGITTVNVGEDAAALVANALQALHSSQTEKSNHCQLWTSNDNE